MTLTLAILKATLEYHPETGLWTRLHQPNKAPQYNSKWAGRVCGMPTSSGRHVCISINNKEYLAHRLAWFYMTGAWPTDVIDHINGDATDNRWINLRPATQSENMANQSISSRNTSGVTGVIQTKTGKFRAYLNCKKKHYDLGQFDTKEEAIKARRDAEDKFFGSFSFHKSRSEATQ